MALHVIRLEDPIQAQQQPFAQLWGATQNLGPLALPRASLPTSSYIRPEFPIYGRFRVKVISAPQGPYGFTIQLLNDEDNLSLFQEQLQALLHQPFEYEPPIGAPCVLLSWDLRYYRGCITAAADENRFMVEHVDRGSSEMCNLTQLRQISEALLRVPTFTYRVSLEDAERMIYLKGLDKVFQGILTNAQVLVAEGIPGAPNRIALYIHDGRSVYDILAGVFGFGRTQMPTATCTPSPLPAQVLLGHSSQIPDNDLGREEFLQVLHTRDAGRFFGFLTRRSKEELNKLTLEMATYYAREKYQPQLYADVKSHVGQFGVIKLPNEPQYHRIKILQELANDAEILLIDDGSRMTVSRGDVLAPLSNLTTFLLPPFGIECKVDNVSLSDTEWSSVLENQPVHVRIEDRENGFYKVSFTDNPCNGKIKLAITEKPNENGVRSSPDSLSPSSRDEGPNRRRTANGDNGAKPIREGYAGYQHPNAASRNGGKKADKDTNWRAGNGQAQEVIRNPRGPPPMDANAKGPLGFQNSQQQTNQAPPMSKPEPQPSVSPHQKEQSTSTVGPAKSPPKPDPPSRLTYPAQALLHRTIKKIQIVFVEDVDSFFVQLVGFSEVFSNLAAKLQSLYQEGSSNATIENPTVGSACVAKFQEDKNWYRGQIVSLNGEDAEILFVDYGNRQRTPLTDIKVIKPHFLNLQPQAYLCRMAGINPRARSMENSKEQLEQRFSAVELEAIFSGQDVDGKYRVRLFQDENGVRKVVNEFFGAHPIADAKPLKSLYTSPELTSCQSDFIAVKFYSVDRFYLKPSDISNLEDELTALEEFYSSLGEDELIEDEPSVGLPCVVKCKEDEMFYRSKITSLDGEGATVVFVDRGRQQQTALESLRRMLPSFMEPHTLVVECGLVGVKSVANLASDRQKLINDCFIDGLTVKAVMKFQTEDGSEEAEVTHPTYGDLTKYFLENGLVELSSMPIRFATNFIPQNLNSMCAQDCYDNVVVYHAPSPSEFWAQLVPDVVENVMGDINVFSKTLEFQNESTFKPEVGKACLAFYSDGNWYRAVILDLSGDLATVHYVDYGNSSMVSLAELRGLPTSLAKEPPLAVKCTLQDAHNIPEDLQKEFENLFEYPVTLRVVERVDDVLHVCLSSQDGEDLCKKLACGTSDVESTPQETGPEVQVDTKEDQLRESEPLSIGTPCETVRSLNFENEETESSFENTKNVENEIVESLEMKEVDACFSFVVSPGDFWMCCPHGVAEDELRELQEALKTMYSPANISQYVIQNPASIGEVYGARHPDLNEWFRARIVSIEGADIKAHFIDRGDTQLLTVDDVCQLPERWKSVRDLAVHCSLDVPEGCDGWSLRTLDLFQEHAKLDVACRVKLGVLQSGVYKVESLCSQDVDLIEMLKTALDEDAFEVVDDVTDTSSGFARGTMLTTVTEHTEVESEQHVTGDANATGQTIFNNETPTSDCTTLHPSSSESCNAEAEQTPSEDYADELPHLEMNFIPGEILSAQASVIEILSSHEVLLNLNAPRFDQSEELMTKIGDPKALPLLEPQVGRACLSLYPLDGCWYRAVVKDVQQNQATVLYVDYGNTATVQLEDLRRLPVSLATVRGDGLKCALDGFGQSPTAAPPLETLKSLVSELDVKVVFVSRASEHVFVRLFDKNGMDLNQKFAPPERELSFMNRTDLKAVFGDVTMASVMIDDSRLDADVTAQAGDSILIEALVKKEPLDPSLAALPESDLTVSNENMAVGHETVKCDLMPESVELVVTEQQEHGYAKPMVVLHTDKFEAPEVHQSTEQDEPVIAANAEPADQSQSGLDEMKRCSDNESMEQTAKAEHEAPESVGIVCAEDVDLNPANENFKKSQSPNINQTANEETIEETETRETVYISFASATDHFWILHDHAVVTVIDEKLQALNLDDNAEFVLNENPVVGGLYAVFHSVYENWFRGRVVSTDTTKCLASILFVDYGDSQDTKFDKIRELPESLASIPPCARECKCLTLGQDRSMWTEEAAEALTEICTLGTPVEAVFNTKSEAGASEIESLHLNGHNVIDLINRRLAGESLQSVVSAQSNERSRDQQASLS